MKLKMARQSLFAMLLRSPWWVSFVLAGVMAALARLVLPQPYEVYALFSAVPFAGIGCIAAWKQLRTPSAARVGATLAAAEALPWPKFADAVEQALRRDGQAVMRLPGPAADFEVTRAGRLTLVACRRWKAAQVGVEPLRELQAAMDRRGASAGLHVALGEPTDAARAYAAAHRIELLQGPALAALLARVPRPKKG
jgi:restriction system protein